jgi:two-component system repressor protein LuxO
LHLFSNRNNGPFISINCAALPAEQIDSALFGHIKGAFTDAHQSRDGAIKKAINGTLFLDEIGDLTPSLQIKLLRFTQDLMMQPVGSDKSFKADIRLIFATNKNLELAIKNNSFREDLFYRLQQFHIHMPPLKEKKSDILSLIDYYSEKFSEELNTLEPELSSEVISCLINYNWPGNVRELQNFIRHLIINFSGSNNKIKLDNLPRKIKNNSSAFYQTDSNKIHIPLRQIEKNAIENAIIFCNGNIAKAAHLLDVSPSTLYRKMQSWKTANIT